jgi:O-antigen/teichoic acid export membrane protein
MVTAGSGGVFWIIATRLASPEEIGFASSAIASAMLLATISTLGLPHALVRYIPTINNSASDLINSAFLLSGLTSCVLAVVFLVGIDWWAPSLVEIRDNLYWAIAFVLFTLGATIGPLILLHIFMAFRQGRMVFAEGTVEGILKLVLIASLAGVIGGNGVFFAWGLPVVLAFLFGVLFLLPRVYNQYRLRLVFKPKLIRMVWRFSLASYVSDLAWFTPAIGLFGWILPLIMLNLVGRQQSAYFYIVWLMAAMMNTIPVSSATSLLAEGSHSSRELYSSAWSSLKMSMLLLLPIVVCVTLLSDIILKIYGEAYSENASGLLILLAVATLPLAINTLSLGIWKVERKLKHVAGLGIMVSGITITLTYILTPNLGLLGVGWAWLAAQSISVVIFGPVLWGKVFRNRMDSKIETNKNVQVVRMGTMQQNG